MLKAINFSDRPEPAGFSYSVEATGTSRMLFISGQVAKKKDGTVPEGIASQTEVVLDRLKELLGNAGMTLENVVKTTVLLTNKDDIPAFSTLFFEAMPSPATSSTGMVVSSLWDPAYILEIEAIAVA